MVCSKCKQTKPPEAFSKSNRGAAKRQWYCKECYSAYRRARRYKISVEELEALFAVQNGQCAICTTPIDRYGSQTHVDHHHGTGTVRGLLCRGCNLAIGWVGENPETLRKMIAYLAA